jgi:predicted dehydrogenase
MINWGIIGLGRMGSQFAQSIIENENCNLLAISSKSKKKIEQFSKKYKIKSENKFLLYKDLIKKDDINAIYISTLNNTHVEIILDALKNKKKILCEKPIGLNLKEAELVLSSLTNTKNFYYEAIAYRSHPQTQNLLNLIKDNEIGEIYKIEASFGFKVKKIDSESRLFKKEFGGGAILDLGCYPLSFFNLFCNKNSKIEINKMSKSLCYTNVDDEAEVNLSLNNNIEAIGKVSLKKNLENNCKIYGKKGIINIPSPWLPSEKSFIEITTKNHYHKVFLNLKKNIYFLQAEKISNNFLNKDLNNELLVDINESVKLMSIIDRWLKC